MLQRSKLGWDALGDAKPLASAHWCTDRADAQNLTKVRFSRVRQAFQEHMF